MASSSSSKVVCVEPYSLFAKIYDATMSEVPYSRWASFVSELLQTFSLSSSSSKCGHEIEGDILEIACGSGLFLQQFQKYHSRLMGLDISMHMLCEAKKKLILPLFCADMRFLPLAAESFSALITLHDSLNYLQTYENLLLHFGEASRILRQGGIYLFDLSSEYNVIRYFHGQTFKEHHNGIDMHWSNRYNMQTRVITSVVKMRQAKQWVKEIHEQKIFSQEEALSAAQKSGLEFLASYGDYRLEKNLQTSQLIVYVFRKI